MAYDNKQGLQEWIDYCEEIIKANPYTEEMNKGNNDFDKHLELAVKSKIYHTAIHEFRLKLKEMLRAEYEKDKPEEEEETALDVLLNKIRKKRDA